MPRKDDSGKMRGTVEWFDLERGVGAIRPDEDEEHCVVSAATLADCGVSSLSAGDRVGFQIEIREGERHAVDLSPAPGRALGE